MARPLPHSPRRAKQTLGRGAFGSRNRESRRGLVDFAQPCAERRCEDQLDLPDLPRFEFTALDQALDRPAFDAQEARHFDDTKRRQVPPRDLVSVKQSLHLGLNAGRSAGSIGAGSRPPGEFLGRTVLHFGPPPFERGSASCHRTVIVEGSDPASS